MNFTKNELQVVIEALLHTETTGIDKHDIQTKMFVLALVNKTKEYLDEISNPASLASKSYTSSSADE